MQVESLYQEDLPEQEMTTNSSILSFLGNSTDREAFQGFHGVSELHTAETEYAHTLTQIFGDERSCWHGQGTHLSNGGKVKDVIQGPPWWSSR